MTQSKTDVAMIGEYTETELHTLHQALHKIMGEVIRVCEVLQMPYFIQGGTAIGAYYEQDILPWDDDIDVGLTRENYTRFLREAPAVVGEEFFLQHFSSDPHTPFYFAKLMLKGTTFTEADFSSLDIQRGIYIDIFPFDKVPDRQWLQRSHRFFCNFLNGCFMAKDIWQWKHIRKCQVEKPRKRGWFPCFATWVVCKLASKKRIYDWLSRSQALFNGGRHEYYNMVLMPRDHISVRSIENPQLIPFGPNQVWAPSDLFTYLDHHYPGVQRYVPKEKQRNHHPAYLDFGDFKG